ncbi:MAG TPA: Calx-beta domain-containing protein, partial [Thermoanaerobaculia bacterium]|nr:Calx-beta domain-containing protein [Thermoanaerobaculia bacterium]
RRRGTMFRMAIVIMDEQSRLPKLRLSDDTSPREGSTTSFKISLDAPAKAPVAFRVATVGDTAEPGLDFAPIANVYTIERGETSVTVNVATVDDGLSETDETFSLSVSELSNARLGDAIARATIVDDDSPTPVFTIADIAVPESGGTAQFVVQLATPSMQRVTLTYGTMNGSAVNGGDYNAVQGTVVFEPGEMAKVIAVAIVNDDQREPDETFTLRVGARTDAVCTIVDDDVKARGRTRSVRH